MASFRELTRRSFLARVAGGGAGALIAIRSAAQEPEEEGARRMVVDRDPDDPAREPRRPRPRARGGTSQDSDPTDPAGHGRGGMSAVTDSDSGANADAVGSGRGPTQSFIVCPGHRRCPQ